MSINNYILKLLNIKEIKGKNYKIIEGVLTYNPEYYPCCKIINQSTNDIIKWGFRKNCIVKIPKQGNCLTRLILHKQRFFCKLCNNTFISETNLVNKNISNNTNLQIRLELMEKQSEKDIAKRMDVSVSVIDRILNEI